MTKGGGGVKNLKKMSDIICGSPLTVNRYGLNTTTSVTFPYLLNTSNTKEKVGIDY